MVPEEKEEAERQAMSPPKGFPAWNKGLHPSEETRRKQSESSRDSEARKQMFASEEYRKKMSEALKGRTLTDDHKRKIGESNKGQIRPTRGIQRSPEIKERISTSLKGRTFSEEHCKRISEVKLGKIRSEESRLKQSLALKGRKKPLEWRKARSGANSPNWKGGISFEPYCPKFSRELKERVRSYFNNQCFVCLTPQNGRKLHVHHVNYDKMVCCNDVKPLFVPLCNSCHTATNNNRESLEQYFTDTLNQYYNGKCFFTPDEYRVVLNEN